MGVKIKTAVLDIIKADNSGVRYYQSYLHSTYTKLLINFHYVNVTQ